MKRAVVSLGISLVLSGAVLAQTPPTSPQTPTPTPDAPPTGKIIQKILVKVNGEPFKQTDLERQLVNAIKEKRPSISDVAELNRDPALIAIAQELTPDILVDTVDDLLLYQHGKEIGYRMTDERFRSLVDNFKKQNKLDDAQLKAALAEEGLTMESWREMAERQSIIQQVQSEEIMQRAQPLDEDRRQYYAAHPDEFMSPATVTLHVIVVALPTQTQNGRPVVSAADDEVARAKATAIRERIVKGEDFNKVASEVSESPSKANGGVLGEFKLEELDKPMRDILDKLKVGEMTEPLRTANGYQIIKLAAKADPQLQPFDKVRDEIAEKIYYERLEVEQKRFLVKVRANALIQWFDPALKASYEKRLQERMAESK